MPPVEKSAGKFFEPRHARPPARLQLPFAQESIKSSIMAGLDAHERGAVRGAGRW